MENSWQYAREGISIMGPYSEAKQLQRAEAIGFLLDNNPQLDPVYRAMWENKLRALSQNEEEYNRRVVGIYKDKNREVVEWGL